MRRPEERGMRFHRFTAVIALTGLWAVIVLFVGDDFFGSRYRFTGFWDRYLAGVALGAGVIWLVVYLISWVEATADDEAARKPVALLEYRPGIPVDLRPRARPTR